MPEVTKYLRSPLYQVVGASLYVYWFETVSDQVVMADETGGTVQDRIGLIESQLSQNTTTYVVADVEAMEAIESPLVGDGCWVVDASADESVESGAAKYIYQDETNGWVKVSEAESMDVVVSWSDIEDRPAVLDGLGEDSDGNLTYNGEPVGSGDSASKPWTAYGEGIDAAPEGLRETGLYVSDGEEAPADAVSAVLRQKRGDALTPIYPRTEGSLVAVAVDGLESADAEAALGELAGKADAAQSAAEAAQASADQASADAASAQSSAESAQATADDALAKAEAAGSAAESAQSTADAAGEAASAAQSTADSAAATAQEALTKAEAGGGEAGDLAVEVEALKSEVESQASTITSLTETVEAQASTIEALEAQVEALENAEVSQAYVTLASDLSSGTAVSTQGVSYTPGSNRLFVYYEGVKLIVGENYEETDSDTVTLLFDAESGSTLEFVRI